MNYSVSKIAPAAVLALLTLLAAPSSGGAEVDGASGDAGLIVRQSGLRHAPSEDAVVGTSLPLGSRVRVIRFQGRWARVEAADSGQGWIPAANVRLSDGESTRGGGISGFLRRVTGAVSAGTQPDQSASNMGIRGLEAADVANAEPNPAELQKLDRYRATAEAAQRHARDVQLASRSMSYPDPDDARRRDTAPAATPRGRD